MSNLLITHRDVLLFEYLHACKVATTKQINRDVFKTAHATCYQRLKKYEERKSKEGENEVGQGAHHFPCDN